jgi:RNA polymerase sigma factor (sigma-70 family)
VTFTYCSIRVTAQLKGQTMPAAIRRKTTTTLDTPASHPFFPGARVSPSHIVDMDEEDVLIARLQQRDGRAYEVLVRRYSAQMLAVARHLLRNEADARDAVQDAFLSAFRALPTFRADAKLSTWLHRIVTNAALMKFRAASRRPEVSLEPLLPTFAEDGRHAAGGTILCNSGNRHAKQRDARDRTGLHRTAAGTVPSCRNSPRRREHGYGSDSEDSWYH